MKVKWSQEGNGLDLLGAGASEGRYQDGEYGACSIQREKVEEVEEVEEVAKVEADGVQKYTERNGIGQYTVLFEEGTEIASIYIIQEGIEAAQLEEEYGESFTSHGSPELIQMLYKSIYG